MGPAVYLGPDEALHVHPDPAPAVLSDVFVDASGNAILITGGGHDALIFDATLGHFRPFRQSDMAPGEAIPDPQMLRDGPITRFSNAPPRLRITYPGPRGPVATDWHVAPGKCGVELSWSDGVLMARSAKGSRILNVPGGGRRLSTAFELANPGRVVLVFDGPSVVTVDADLVAREIPGSWRFQGNLDSYPALGRDEALLVDRFGVFRLVNKPLSGAALCPTVDTPPEGAVSMRPLDEITAFLPDNYVHRRLQAVSIDGSVFLAAGHKVIRLPVADAGPLTARGADGCVAGSFTCAWDTGQYNWGFFVVPGTRSLLLNGKDALLVFGTTTAAILRYDDPKVCCKEIAPLGVNPASGAILLSDGRMLLPEGTIAVADLPRFSPGRFTAYATPSWLTTPLFGLFRWEADNRFVPLDAVRPALDRGDGGLRQRWLDLDRFGVLATEYRGSWQRIGADLVLHEMPGSTREPRSNLPNPALTFETPVYDPGVGDVLVGQHLSRTGHGLWGIGSDGSLHRIACADECKTGAITAIVADPGSPHAALVGTEAGLLRYDAEGDAILHRAVPIAVTGSVRDLLAIPWEGAVLIFADFGTFLYSADGALHRLPEMLWRHRLIALPEVQMILGAEVPPVVVDIPED